MVKRIPHLFLILVLVIVALACVTPISTTPDPNFINTAIAQTQTAAPILSPRIADLTMTSLFTNAILRLHGCYRTPSSVFP
jgi:hypothetical protein